MSADEPTLSVEAQLAVLRTKIDQLLDLSKTRGEDHEARIRLIERTREDYITKKATYALVTLVCMVTAAGTNVIAFLLK